MELRAGTSARLRTSSGGAWRAPLAAVVAATLVVLGAPAPAGAAETRSPELEFPTSQTEPPHAYRLSAREAIAIADRDGKVVGERHRGPRLRPTAYMHGSGRWQVSYFEGGRERVQVQVDDRYRTVLESWSGPQVAWTMARGYEGAFARKLNAPYVWIPLCLLFVLPFVDPRRPLRLLHLDLLVLLAFGASHVFFNRGEISTSVPLVYPVLLYLLIRLLVAGFHPRERWGKLVPLVPTTWLAVALVFLVGFRVGLNVIDSTVIDVGYSGVIGADRIADGEPLYGGDFPSSNQHGDTYGPLNYLAYVPFEQVLPWSGAWDDLPAAHAAAIGFDLVTLVGLLVLGRRMRPGAEGRTLGLALAFAWAAYPYTLFVLNSNANDSLISASVVLALLTLTAAPARRRMATATRGALVAVGTAVKFVPLALAPLLAAGRGERHPAALAAFAAGFAAVLVAAFSPFLPDGGFSELWDRTVGYQAGRPAPFSLWGQEPSLDWLQIAVKVGAGGLALAVAFLPRRRGLVQVAALGSAVVVAVQLSMTYWFYLYVVWFAPLALIALLGEWRPVPSDPGRALTSDGEARRAEGARETAREPALV